MSEKNWINDIVSSSFKFKPTIRSITKEEFYEMIRCDDMDKICEKCGNKFEYHFGTLATCSLNEDNIFSIKVNE